MITLLCLQGPMTNLRNLIGGPGAVFQNMVGEYARTSLIIYMHKYMYPGGIRRVE